ncbi:archaeal/vacuolar-type H+-ATPase subunit I [Methanomethylovorans hollandica DSM 15978]|uniref:A-type ATP synthase subunit I n=1 Tax=Methanomethylovorans hollandica (strain DSM 15978 / NBRC 107637 / DMS1) TaxID=867904 RepID=L0KUG2_METHD|nr:V-type ATP synthase subunit I [Methanomethylovorans hollandica]AGB49077.1 archaeal/vacuolar-type H+-ATPase subunit I [Methanomethylovorans hollandica DSM 15978]
MLNPRQMSRALIVGHKDLLEKTVEVLHQTNLFQIEDYIEDDSGLKIGKPFDNGDSISKALIKIRSIASFLEVKNEPAKKQKVSTLLRDLDSTLKVLDTEVSTKTETKSGLETRVKEIESLKKDLLPFADIPLDLDLYRGYDNLAIFPGIVKGNIENEISGITGSYELFTDHKSGTIVLFVPKRHKEDVSKALSDYEYRELKVPDQKGMPAEIISRIDSERTDLLRQIDGIDSDIRLLKDKYKDFIMASNEVLSIEVDKSEAPLHIATSESTFVIEGWVPSDSYNKLERAVSRATQDRVFVTQQEIEHEQEPIVPVEYDNPKVVRPLQEIMNLYARPRYKELDPTSLIFITFPLFYGMILGDIGYALILMALALVIKKTVKSDAVKPLMNILIYCQISTFIFGILYGEFLGFPLAGLVSHGEIQAGLIPGFNTIDLFASPVGGEMITYPIHRTHLVMTMIVFTALIGVIHINIGYILGFINENRKHGFSAALLEKGSWIIIQLGILLVVLGYFGILPSALLYAGIIVFLAGFVMLLKGEGIKGPVELPSLLSNSLSYTRLIAVGLSSIYIASTVNMIAFEMIWPDKFGPMTVFAILVFIFGHALNTVLSIIAPGLHALRLQYVEFFGKFYEGGGRKYDPFGYIRKYTEE